MPHSAESGAKNQSLLRQNIPRVAKRIFWIHFGSLGRVLKEDCWFILEIFFYLQKKKYFASRRLRSPFSLRDRPESPET